MTLPSELESPEELLAIWDDVLKWERDQKSLFFWEKALRLPYALLDRVTPRVVQEKLGGLVDGILSYISNGGSYLVDEEKVLKQYRSRLGYPELTLADVSRLLPMSSMVELAEEMSGRHVQYAKVQGGITGAGGIFTLAVDIPALLGISFHALQDIALAYGYDPREEAERVFIVKCLQFASSDIVGKRAILEEVHALCQGEGGKQVVSQLQGWREVAASYIEGFGWKKLLQIVPIAGILTGAYLNKKSLEDVAEAGTMLYRKRRAAERLAGIGLAL